jgi:hypothetical protein
MLRVHEVTEQLLDRQTFNDFFDPEIFLSSLLTKSIFPGTLFPDHVAEFPDTESRPSRSTYWQSSSAAHRKKISITDVYKVSQYGATVGGKPPSRGSWSSAHRLVGIPPYVTLRRWCCRTRSVV